MTPRGGARANAGRPRGSRKRLVRLYLDATLADALRREARALKKTQSALAISILAPVLARATAQREAGPPPPPAGPEEFDPLRYALDPESGAWVRLE